MATIEMKAKLFADYEAKIAEVNKVCVNGTNAEVEGKLNELANIEKEYRSLTEKEVFASLDSMEAALIKHHFETISHKKVSDDGRLVGVEKSTKDVQVDIKRFCEYKGYDISWFYEMQALNKRLTLKVALSIGMKPDAIRKINDSYAMDKLAEQIELGKTPESNTQVIKHMQKVLDMIAPECGKVNNYDLAYVMAGYTKRSNKESLKVVCSKHSVLQSLLTDVFHNVITGKGYGIDFKRKSVTETEVTKAEEKVSKPTEKKATKKAGSAKKAAEKVSATEEKPAETETVVAKREEPAA